MYDNDVPDRAEAGKVEVAEGKDSWDVVTLFKDKHKQFQELPTVCCGGQTLGVFLTHFIIPMAK